jgi:hypothetical protein
MKFDYQTVRASSGPHESRWNVGLGWMF